MRVASRKAFFLETLARRFCFARVHFRCSLYAVHDLTEGYMRAYDQGVTVVLLAIGKGLLER